MYVSAGNMNKSWCFALVLAVICPSTLEANETCRLEDVVEEINTRLGDVVKEIEDLKRLLASASTESDAVEPSKQALVSALVSNCVPLLIQQRVDGSNFFNRSWAEFKVGFGDPSGNYWLGNDLLSQLTANNSYKLKFDLQSRKNNNWYYAEYSTFIVLTEADNYTLQVAGYSGNAGDAFSFYHNGMMFSTYDRDNDLRSFANCAAHFGGGFWYNNCFICGVNADRNIDNFNWVGLPGGWVELQSSRMWLQCK